MATVSPGGPVSLEPVEHWAPTTISPGRLRELIATGEVRDGASLAAYALALTLADR